MGDLSGAIPMFERSETHRYDPLRSRSSSSLDVSGYLKHFVLLNSFLFRGVMIENLSDFNLT